MNATVLGLLFVPDALKLQQVLTFFFFEHIELLSDASFLVFKKFDLELVDFFLLVFVYVLEFTFFKCKLAIVVSFTKRIGRNWRDRLSILSHALLLLLRLFL